MNKRFTVLDDHQRYVILDAVMMRLLSECLESRTKYPSMVDADRQQLAVDVRAITEKVLKDFNAGHLR